MREIFEFRISDKNVLKKLPENFGVDINRKYKYDPEGSISILYGELRKIFVERESPEWNILNRVMSKNKLRLSLVGVKCIYTKKEVRNAKIFVLIPAFGTLFEPAGVECGTKYDESNVCNYCGIGYKQQGDLILNLRKAKKNKDICVTISGEFIISERFKNILLENKITGIDFRKVRDTKGKYSSQWFQPIITSPRVKFSDQTKFGMWFVDDKSKIAEFVCPNGHIKGLNLLSEIYIEKESWDGSDITATSQYWGYRSNLLNPIKAILISPKLFWLMKENNLKGWDFEIAYFV